MSDDQEIKRTKSFYLKEKNARKVETIAFKKRRKESDVVDEMIEVFPDGD